MPAMTPDQKAMRARVDALISLMAPDYHPPRLGPGTR
jgi:hypothetical protein